MTALNYSTAVMLFNDKIRAIKTIYNPKEPERKYTFKTLDPSIKVGDFVVVPTDTRHGKTVVEVVDVDVEIDFDSSVQIAWVIDKVNLANHEAVLAEEAKWIESIKASEKRKKKQTIRDNMQEMLAEQGIELPAFGETLSIAAE